MIPFKRKTSFALIVASSLAGCGGSGTSDYATDSMKDVTLSGSVGDGPIVGATVSVTDVRGTRLNSVTSDAYANYLIKVQTGKSFYPLVISADGGTDLVSGNSPDFPLTSATFTPSVKKTNLNPFTTISVSLAEALSGGLNQENMTTAQEIVLDTLNFGLDKSLIPDPASTQIDEVNAPVMIKASEALAEMLRRTRDTLISTGRDVSAADVIQSLASDLIDRVLDGQGGQYADPRTAAIAHLAIAQILMETIQNRLEVAGSDATSAIDNAIKTTFPSISADSPTAQVRLSAQMLLQAQRALKIADEALTEVDLSANLSSLQDVPSDALPSEIQSQSIADISSSLTGALSLIAIASEAEIDRINRFAEAVQTTDSDTSQDGTGSGDPASGTRLVYATSANPGSVQPLSGATLSGNIYFFLDESSDWAARGINKVVFYCCQGESQPHVRFPEDTTAPYSIQVDLSQYAAGSVRELYADVYFDDQYTPENLNAYFKIGDSSSDPTTTPDETPADSTGSATLSWTPPTTNTDGSWLNNLSGYKIYYGTSQGSYGHVLDVSSSITEYTVDNLAPSTYYFSVTSYNSKGVESSRSNVVTKTIR